MSFMLTCKMTSGLVLGALIFLWQCENQVVALDAAAFATEYGMIEEEFFPDAYAFNTDPVPLLGMTTEDMMIGEDGLVLNLVDFPAYVTANSDDGFTDQTTTVLSELLAGYLKDERGASRVTAIDCYTLEETNNSVTSDGSNMRICADIAFNRSVILSSEGGLFESFFSPFELSVDSPQVVDVGLRFLANLDAGDVGYGPFWPLVNTAVNATIRLALGAVDFIAYATGYIDGMWALEVCLTEEAVTCPGYQAYGHLGYPLPIPVDSEDDDVVEVFPVYMARKLSYMFEGPVELGMDINGFELDGDASFYLEEVDYYDSDITLDSTGVDFAAFLRFWPHNFLDLLRIMDSGIVCAQESTPLTVKIPFLETTYPHVLATGSILAPSLMDIFAMSEPFEDRDVKSLQLRGTFDVNNSDVDLDFYGLKFLFLEGELTVNPDYPHELKNQAGIEVCDISGISPNLADAEAMAAALASAISGGGCGVSTCSGDACSVDSDGNIYDCNCDVLIQSDEEGKVILTSVAWSDNGKEQPRDI